MMKNVLTTYLKIHLKMNLNKILTGKEKKSIITKYIVLPSCPKGFSSIRPSCPKGFFFFFQLLMFLLYLYKGQ